MLGGPGQLPHLAPTYAAILALCTLGTPEAYKIIKRPALQRFLLHMHQDDGSYIMHQDGERDIRYTVMYVAEVLLSNHALLTYCIASTLQGCVLWPGISPADQYPQSQTYSEYSGVAAKLPDVRSESDHDQHMCMNLCT